MEPSLRLLLSQSLEDPSMAVFIFSPSWAREHQDRPKLPLNITHRNLSKLRYIESQRAPAFFPHLPALALNRLKYFVDMAEKEKVSQSRLLADERIALSSPLGLGWEEHRRERHVRNTWFCSSPITLSFTLDIFSHFHLKVHHRHPLCPHPRPPLFSQQQQQLNYHCVGSRTGRHTVIIHQAIGDWAI